MVVGRGMVAKKFDAFAQDDNVLIFASGVSNSKCTDEKEYARERNLMMESLNSNKDKIFVYVSTYSVFDPSQNESHYVKHKLNVEQYIAEHANRYLILRASNLVGKSTNPNTVLNFFVDSIKHHKKFNLWQNATRNLLDVDDFYAIGTYILAREEMLNKIYTVANPIIYSVKDIVEAIEEHLKIKADCEVVDRGKSFEVDISDIAPMIERLGINFDKDYLSSLLVKYY